MSVTPYPEQKHSKKEQVTTMFNRIAHSYDLLNHLLSLGIHNVWRKRVAELAKGIKAPVVLDVATGTGDLAIALTKCSPAIIYGIDISSGMLEKAKKKILKRGLQHTIMLQNEDSEHLPFKDNYFDIVSVAFGVRNFGDLKKGLSEMQRVLKPGGKVIVLELSHPSGFPIKQLYNFYFKRILPLWGGIISKDKEAFSYLPASVIAFPEGEMFEKMLSEVGLTPVHLERHTFGIAIIYVATKA